MNPYSLTKEQYQELYKEVLLFAQIGGVTNDEDVLWKMCEEEFVKELIPAVEAEDALKVIDGTCDSWVTTIQLHHYYMSKPSWELPIPETTYLGDFYQLEYMVANKYDSLVHSSLQKLLFVSEALAQEYNFNLYEAIKEVNRSNMSKFPSLAQLYQRYAPNCQDNIDEQVLDMAAKECEELSNGKYKDVVVFQSWLQDTDKEHWLEEELCKVVFRNEGGKSKIVKHLAFYEEPNFDHCWL